MPYTQVMRKFKKGKLHSGSDKGPKVKNPKQAMAIMLSEKKKADEGDEEYMDEDQKKGLGPSMKAMDDMTEKKKDKSKRSMFKRR